MPKKRSVFKGAMLVAVLGVVPPLLGCKLLKGDDDGASAASAQAGSTGAPLGALKFQPTPEQKAAADAIAAKVNSYARFPHDQVGKENAKLFVYLAATGTSNDVIAAALDAMRQTHGQKASAKVEQVDDDYASVVMARVAAADGRVQARALNAAKSVIIGKEARSDVISKIVEVAKASTASPFRMEIIDTLYAVPRDKQTPDYQAIWFEALDSADNYLISRALFRLTSVSAPFDQAALKTKLVKLTASDDPGVRGRAIEILGSRFAKDKDVVDIAMKALDDKHPYVRSEAAGTLRYARHKPAIHKLVKLLDDKEKNTYDIRGFKKLDGTTGSVHHDGSAWSRVYDAVINAIVGLSDPKLKLERINYKQAEKDLDRNAKLTKAWYQKNKGSIPAK